MDFSDLLYSSTALFLDFDGTLVDIAEQPDEVAVPPGLVQTLGLLNDYLGGALAVISGRPIDQIDDFLRPLRLPAAGVHGAERRSAGGQMSLISAPVLDLVEQAARKLAAQHAGLLVETKRGSVALHYRQAPELDQACLAAMRAAVEESPGVTLLQGKMVVEAKPSGATKGNAIEAFLREPPFAGRTPLFVGDDITDEVGFACVQRLGGLGVKVGEGATVAWQRIATPQQLRDQLQEAATARTGKAVTP
ncbi:trehalose-phosphatase [Caenimonas terrae]|uniref:Trehalose 6-phosphate phosphatase n=1 Tax=Caenimonas terrae TaxID=696074 RepID=A0ABW0N9W4_9BURK